MQKNIIVAGANGFIGKNLVKNLLDRGYNVTALDLVFSEQAKDNVTCISVKDKTVEQLAEELVEEYSCFFNLAWVGTSGERRADYNLQLENVRLACDYVKLASLIHCPRMIYASSINEMETYEYLQSDNIEPSGGYIYGAGKLAAHLMGET
jgi:nucleoside-diphosphate-sugar epimerase